MKIILNINKLILRSSLFLIAFFSIANTNLFYNISIVDTLILIYIILALFITKVRISKITLQFIIIGNISIAIASLFLFFTFDIFNALFYLGQIWFIITILPIFFEILSQNNSIVLFAKSYLISFYIISFLFLIFAIQYFTNGLDEIWIFRLSGVSRISFGDTLVSNDLGIFLITGLFLTTFLVKKNLYKYPIYFFLSFVYLLTLSKSIFLILIIFWLYTMRHSLLKLTSIVLLISPLIYYIAQNLPRAERLYSVDSDGGGRLSRIIDIFHSPQVFLFPLLGQDKNSFFTFSHDSHSVHNLLLNLSANLGFISTAILLIPVGYLFIKYYNNKNRKRKDIAILALVLIFIILSLNSFMLTRAIWISIFIVIYFYKFYSSQNENYSDY